ncbi:MAG: hypothetical protein FWE61_04580 [Micrococcales bacterium]|nr:hypothetical protein [Micrococcales bacterium]
MIPLGGGARPKDSSLVQGWWCPVPPVWRVPRFDAGALTAQALAEVAAELVARPAQTDVVDVVVERFVVVANAVARDDVDGARSALAGLPAHSWTSGVAAAAWWAHEPASGTQDTRRRPAPVRGAGPLWEREAAVFARLGQVPCVLSQPTWVDLRIDPADLAGRLEAYACAGVAASSGDLALALTRLDTTYADDDVRRQLLCLGPVPVVGPAGRAEEVTAGPVVLQYLATPFHLGASHTPPAGRPEVCFVRGVLDAARQHVDGANPDDPRPSFAVVPWCEATLKVWAREHDAAQGVRLRQVARSAAPLPPGAATAMLTVQRAVHPTAAPDVARAITEAWCRGLLRPGVPDAAGLDGVRSGAVARVLRDLAAEGMLAVVWPVLDAMVAHAAATTPLPAGTVDVADTIAALLGEVVHAVATGLADPAVLDLPGTRALAARTGTSRAVSTARAVVAQLAASTGVPGKKP